MHGSNVLFDLHIIGHSPWLRAVREGAQGRYWNREYRAILHPGLSLRLSQLLSKATADHMNRSGTAYSWLGLYTSVIIQENAPIVLLTGLAIWWRCSLNWGGSLFLKGCSLYQLEKKLTSAIIHWRMNLQARESQENRQICLLRI